MIDPSFAWLLTLIIVLILNAIILFADYIMLKCGGSTITQLSVNLIWPAVILVSIEALIPISLMLHFVYY